VSDLVECRSGSEYAERPLAFRWQGQRLEVAEVAGRGRTPLGRYFRVQTRDGRLFDLVYTELDETWQVTPV
jgi:hypothetical protein